VGRAGSIVRVKSEVSPLEPSLVTAGLRQLAEQLSLEYAGAVAPGRVLRLVFTTGRRLHRLGYRHTDVVSVTKSSVRSDLTVLIGAGLSSDRMAAAVG
jgi:hypothetical protein